MNIMYESRYEYWPGILETILCFARDVRLIILKCRWVKSMPYVKRHIPSHSRIAIYISNTKELTQTLTTCT